MNLQLVGRTVRGSVPMGVRVAYLQPKLGNTSSAQDTVETFLGAALQVGAGAKVFRYYLDRRSGKSRIGLINDVQVTPAAGPSGSA